MEELSKMDDSKWFGVLAPVKRAKPIKSNPVIIGFDTEFVIRDNKQELLSIQFATDKSSCLAIVVLAKHLGEVIYPDNYEFPTSVTSDTLGLHLLIFLQNYLGYTIDAIPDAIYLVSHFSQAEISNISNLDALQLSQYNKALAGSFKLNLGNKQVTIHLVDLYGLLPTSLDKIGDYIGIPKLSLDGIGGKPESYWYANMDKLYTLHPDLYRDYAITDAVIAYNAYTKLRGFFIDKYSLDILDFKTLPSISGYIFRRDYLKDYLTPIKTINKSINQKKFLSDKQPKYYKVIQKQPIYAGSLDVRHLALLAYHGARVESFYCGRLDEVNLVYYDVDSLYPSSCMLQPLPVKDTTWHKLPGDSPSLTQQLLQSGEGFVEVEFSFPNACQYPCLPVEGIRDGILYFPSNGVGYFTLSELRLAIKLGLSNYEILSGYAFLPTDKEINHPLKQYMQDLHKLKTSTNKDTIDYSMYKLLMNSLVGKLIQQDTDNTALELVKDKLLPINAYNKVIRKLSRAKSVGMLWLPEYASLILGKARSLISEFVALGAYFVSTDSVLLPKGVDISCQALPELQSVGSNLKHEFPVSQAVIIRSRLYALNPFENTPANRYVARHSIHLPESDFLDRIRHGFITKALPDLDYKTTRLIKLAESIRLGKPLNSSYTYEGRISLEWDGKRELLAPVDNPFAEGIFTKPLTSTEVNNNKARKALTTKSTTKPGRKPGKGLSRENKEAIKELFEKEYTQAQIAKELGLSKGYVSKVVKQINVLKAGGNKQ